MKFKYELAHALGRADASRMMEEMTMEDWRYWQAMDLLEPIGRSRQDYAIAQLTQLVAGVLGGSKASGSVEDWLPVWKFQETKPKTGEEMAAEMRGKLSRIVSASGKRAPG